MQGTYFKICLTYFKISQTYFCEGRNGVSGIKTNSDPRPAGALCKGKHYQQHTPAGLPPIYNNVYSPGRAGGRQQIKMHCLNDSAFYDSAVFLP